MVKFSDDLTCLAPTLTKHCSCCSQLLSSFTLLFPTHEASAATLYPLSSAVAPIQPLVLIAFASFNYIHTNTSVESSVPQVCGWQRYLCCCSPYLCCSWLLGKSTGSCYSIMLHSRSFCLKRSATGWVYKIYGPVIFSVRFT